MCLGVPMEVLDVDDMSALCEARGERRRVALWLLAGEAVRPGDHLLVHLGQAMRRLTAEEAAQTWALLDEMLAAAADGRTSAYP